MLKDFFSKPKKKKYAAVPSETAKTDVPEGIMTKCPECKKIMYTKDLRKNLKVCLHCDHHLRMTSYERVESLLDEGSFQEFKEHITTGNPLEFPGYVEKVEKDMKKTDLDEAVLTGTGTMNDQQVVIAVMDSHFRMGSMGSVVGEKITRAIEKAGEMQVPFLIFTASGGARMQEGILSLMQMAKTSAALKMFSEHGGLIVSVMTHPTTGGVSASFASLGDFNFAEPGALIGFAGRRVIEQTIREDLPDDFQTAEFLLDHGQLDGVIHRRDLKEKLIKILDIHQQEGEQVW